MSTPALGRRARNRAARHDQLVAAATELVTEHGLDGLTMQAVADRVDCAVGTIYTYFASKSALMASLMSSAVTTVLGTYHRTAEDWDAFLVDRSVDEPTASLVRILAYERLFVNLPALHPREFEFMQLLISTPEQYISADDVSGVMPQALTLLTETYQLLDQAVASGALAPADDRPGDDALRRTLRWAGAMNGTLMVSNVGGRNALPDEDAFDGRQLSELLTCDLLLAWGAPKGTLHDAVGVVDDMAAAGLLLPSPGA